MKEIQMEAYQWITSLYKQYSLVKDKESFMDNLLHFKIIGFADEPQVYIKPTKAGLEYGYEATQWDGYKALPFPGIYKTNTLSWETLLSLNETKQQEVILGSLMETIAIRKAQFNKCKFCGESFGSEHLFDNDTCHGCATEHYGVLY